MSDIVKTKWEFRAVNPPEDRGRLGDFRPAEVPGTVQMELIRTGDIPDPFLKDNLKDLGWFYGMSWEYRTILPQVPAEKPCHMVFEGIDTVSAVMLNGELIGRTDNMHVRYEFNLTGKLTGKDNELKVLIECPVKYAEKKAKTSDCKASEGQCHGSPKFFYSHIRKPAYSAGWDWLGFVPAASGIWKPAYLHIDDGQFVLQDTNYKIELSEDCKEAVITTVIDAYAYENTVLIASLEVDGIELLPSHRVKFEKGFNSVSLRPIKIVNPCLWCPNGNGTPSLYRMTLKLSGPSESGTVTDEKRIGIRKVRLLQPKDKEGRKFILEINGRNIFAKGGNWVPNDAYLPRVSKEKIDRLVEDAEEAGYNMLRVWGGGIYEDSHFFEACDRAGIMVLMDFPFACNFYPEDEEILSSIRTEAEQNLRRLRHHPSLVLLSGNNECYPCHFVWNKLKESDRFFGRRIYEEVLPEICRDLAPEIPYVRGSPYSPDKPDDPDGEASGDRHAWQLGFGISKEKNYRHMTQEKGRFISEFGYLGMPPYSTVKQFLHGKDISKMDSDTLSSHQNTIVTMKMLKEYIEFMYPFPDTLKEYCYLSMVGQAEMLRYAVEHFRRRKFDCGGAVIWQYNDCWPAPSWSAVDYYLRRKAHFYYMKRAFAQIITSFNEAEDGKLEAWIVNDTIDIGSCELRISRCDCVNVEDIISRKFEMPENGSQMIMEIPTEKMDFRKEFLIADVIKDRKLIARNTYFGVVPKEFSWPSNQDFQVSHKKIRDHEFHTTITSKTFLKDLYLNIDFTDPDAVFSNNFFDILPGESAEIKIRTSKPLNLDEFRNTFSLMHLGMSLSKKHMIVYKRNPPESKGQGN